MCLYSHLKSIFYLGRLLPNVFYCETTYKVIKEKLGSGSGKIFEIWAGFGPVGNTEKNWANYEQLLFSGAKQKFNFF